MNNRSIILVSLFNGLSIGSLALKELNITPVKTYTSEVYEPALIHEHFTFPDNESLGDLTKINFKALRDEINSNYNNPIILLVGGSPCQNFSFVGKMQGMSTTTNETIETLDRYLELKSSNIEFVGQSYLFWEYVRAKKELQPDYFLLENVKMTKYNKDIISNTLNTKPILINSSLVSAQNRERLYWFNWDIDTIVDRGIKFSDIIDTNQPFRELGNWVYSKWGNTIKLNRLKSINADKSSCLTTSKTHSTQYYLNADGSMYRNLTINEWEELQTFPINYVKALVDNKFITSIQAYKLIGNSWTLDIIKEILKPLVKKIKSCYNTTTKN